MKIQWAYFSVIALAGVILTLADPSRASAAGTPLSICNQTSVALVVAYGYHSSGANDTAGSNILTGPFCIARLVDYRSRSLY